MKNYVVLPGKEFFTLVKVYVAGEAVSLPQNEGDAFLGHVLEALPDEPALTEEPTTKSAKKKAAE